MSGHGEKEHEGQAGQEPRERSDIGRSDIRRVEGEPVESERDDGGRSDSERSTSEVRTKTSDERVGNEVSSSIGDPRSPAQRTAFPQPSRKTGQFPESSAASARVMGRAASAAASGADVAAEGLGGAACTPADEPPTAACFAGLFPIDRPHDPELPRLDPARPRVGTRVARRRRLQAVAAVQRGCFTVKQAAAAGLDRRARYHHLSYGNWRPTVAPDVFRLTSWPADPDEHLVAWLLWAGPSASLTSWSSLGLNGLAPSAPNSTVHVVGSGLRSRSLSRRLDVRPALGGVVSVTHQGPQTDRSGASHGVGGTRLQRGHGVGPRELRIHRNTMSSIPPDVVRELPVRPLAESVCVALMSGPPGSVAWDLCDEWVARDLLDRSELLYAATQLGAARVVERLWVERRGRQSVTPER